MERQEEDTFNRFEVLDELGQHEGNTGFTSMDHIGAESDLEIVSSIPLPAP